MPVDLLPEPTADVRPPPPSLWTAERFLAALHPPSSRGRASFMIVDGDRALTRTYDPCELDLVAGSLVDRESYVTQNRSHGPRGRSNIAALTAAWLDLDVHRVPSLSHLERPEIETLIRDRISGAGLPPASFLVDSGRGYHVIWLFENSVAAALPRWSALMRALVEWARPLGADPACIDAARVLRLPGSWHKGACREVTIVDGTAARHDFEDFSSAVWRAAGRPTRRDLGERRTRRAARAAGPTGDSPRAAPRGLSRRAFWSHSLGDLELLLDEWGGVVPTGLRNTWMHLYVTALGWTVGADELTEFAVEKAAIVAPGLSAREVRRTMSSTVRRAERAASGHRGADGRDPRYDYGGGRLAELLGVDRALAETIGLRQIVPADLRADRRRAGRVASRRAAGALPRAVWLAAHLVERERPWDTEAISRATWYRRLAEKRAIRRRALLAGLLAGSASGPEGCFETGPALHYGGEAQPSASARRPEAAKARLLRENRLTPPKTPATPKPRTENAPRPVPIGAPVSVFAHPYPSDAHASDDLDRKEPEMCIADLMAWVQGCIRKRKSMAANGQRGFVEGHDRFQSISDTEAERPIATPDFLGLSPGRVAKIRDEPKPHAGSGPTRPGSRIGEHRSGQAWESHAVP